MGIEAGGNSHAGHIDGIMPQGIKPAILDKEINPQSDSGQNIIMIFSKNGDLRSASPELVRIKMLVLWGFET